MTAKNNEEASGKLPEKEEPEMKPEATERKVFDRFQPIDFENRKGSEFINTEYVESLKRVKGDKVAKLTCQKCNGTWWEQKEVSMHRADVAVAPGQALPPVSTPEGLRSYFVYRCFSCGYIHTPKFSGARPAYAMGAHATFSKLVESKNESKE